MRRLGQQLARHDAKQFHIDQVLDITRIDIVNPYISNRAILARLLAAALKYLAEHPELQDDLRANRDRIPGFLEEVLRIMGVGLGLQDAVLEAGFNRSDLDAQLLVELLDLLLNGVDGWTTSRLPLPQTWPR